MIGHPAMIVGPRIAIGAGEQSLERGLVRIAAERSLVLPSARQLMALPVPDKLQRLVGSTMQPKARLLRSNSGATRG